MILLAPFVLALDLVLQRLRDQAAENARLQAALWEEQRLRQVEREAHQNMRDVTRRTIEAMLDEANRQSDRQLQWPR